MSRTAQSPDPITSLKNRLRLAEQATSDVVLAVESLRAALRHVAAAVDDIPREQVPPSAPALPPKPNREWAAPAAPRFLRFKEVGQMCGLSRTSIWRMEREGRFPERRRIGPNAVRWLTDDVENWINSREFGG